MTDQSILRQILARLTAIEESLQHLADPIAHVSAAEKAEIIKKAMATGNRAAVKAAVKQINGGGR